ncbi:Nucleoside-diphosphate-sugar epimerase [Paracholeplasma brassicae]|uniref:Nucleoside-diphosphate-sugar epimerase n=1 Tax=Acholeplasma brassicae TaxID=61635 RepID=U4KQT7_9MOLU|nr:SDR family oxidoreductase [Paracholeplasma brassicae]CCV65138.1 Nucleoside-diphosphate-sugar epimerase [Paracholeplasma brassicae]
MLDMRFEKSTKFLVTGVAGFIGTNTAEYLLKEGYLVRGLDNFSTGKKSNISELNYPNFEFIEGDIRDVETCIKAVNGIDYVIHLAALGSVPRSIKDPKTSNDVNVSGMLNMLIASKDEGIKTFVYASSSSVYGDEPNLPKTEERIGKPLSPYAVTKYVNELYGHVFHKLYGLRTVGLRYFNVFGRRQDPDSIYAAVIPQFVKKLLMNESPLIHGDGTQSRDFTYIDNVIEANLKACLAKEDAFGKAYNVAFGGQVDVNTLFNTMTQLLNKDIKPVYGPTRPGDVKHSNADIKKARDAFSYDPSVDFKQGISLTMDWYVKTLSV